MENKESVPMSEALTGFLRRASADEELGARLAEAAKVDEGVAGPSDADRVQMARSFAQVAQAEGFDVSPDELVALWEGAGSQELDDAELAQVAGGKDVCACVAFGMGTVLGDKKYCFGWGSCDKAAVPEGEKQEKSFFCMCFAGGGGEWKD